MKTLVAALGMSVLLAGCAGMSDTQQRALTGTGIGAAGGAVVGAKAGNAALGRASSAAGVPASRGYGKYSYPVESRCGARLL